VFHGDVGRQTLLRPAVLRLLLPFVLALAGGEIRAGVADEVFGALESARADAGVAPLERRSLLDEAALGRARLVAALPHRERLQLSRPIGEDLRRAGVEYRRVFLHLDLNRGYERPAAAFVDAWAGSDQSWRTALSADIDAVGLGSARADDGWVVLAVVLIEDPPPARVLDAAELERRTFEAVNEVRSAHGLATLRLDPALTDTARSHCHDMVRRGYFDHTAPDGTGVADRVRRRGLDYRRVGENLHRNAGHEDPVAVAVESWLESPGHRDLLLAPEFTRTGVGVLVEPDTETVTFAQVFLAPAGGEDE